jgi:adenylate cyclase
MPPDDPMAHDMALVEALSPGLARWFIFGAPLLDDPAELLHRFARQLCDAGLDLMRVNFQVRPLNSQVAARLYVWRVEEHETELNPQVRIVEMGTRSFERGSVVQVLALAHGAFESASFRASPFYTVIVERADIVRRRLSDGVELEYPILLDLKKQGATDYIALPIELRGTKRAVASIVTRRAGGFSDADVEGLRAAIKAFMHVLSRLVWSDMTHALLGVYLGTKTAERVLEGKVRRGDVEEIDAAIWFSDLRGFTPLSAGVESRTLIAWLNDYFDAVGGAVVQHQGEILKFIGDAILAVWPVSAERPREATCRLALDAARAANDALLDLNRTREAAGLAPLDHGIGLHVGAAQYGNIGARGRLDFTVIGPAVNQASRLESTCSKLHERVVMSSEFAACAGGGFVPLGEVALKGIATPQAVFGLTPRGDRDPGSARG